MNRKPMAPEGPRIVATGGATPERSAGVAEPVVNAPHDPFRPGRGERAFRLRILVRSQSDPNLS